MLKRLFIIDMFMLAAHASCCSTGSRHHAWLVLCSCGRLIASMNSNHVLVTESQTKGALKAHRLALDVCI
jgi:hypothetical protein